ncbi:hypothetical protein E2C01_024220 [Portunus trituberculatus]|uniref:Uncharacterized protein n=1 Tax=Portunus trituberculatus TaxID=210409 RepID=A0A5B7EBI0_PORTR|nr:hypothetical protein [Portunus trituberculatus]
MKDEILLNCHYKHKNIPKTHFLGVTYDSKMTFRTHIAQLARTAAGKLASLRRISWFLDTRGRDLFYKS